MNQNVRSLLGIGLISVALINPSLSLPKLNIASWLESFKTPNETVVRPRPDGRYEPMTSPMIAELRKDKAAANKLAAMYESFARNLVPDKELIKNSGQLRNAHIKMGTAMFHGELSGKFPKTADIVDNAVALALGQTKSNTGYPNIKITDENRTELVKMFNTLSWAASEAK